MKFIFYSFVNSDSLHTKLFNDKYTHFKELDTQSRILFLFNSVGLSICSKTPTFAYDCMSYRQ